MEHLKEVFEVLSIYKFSSYSENCLLCNQILFDAYRGPCGSNYCKECIEKHIEDGKTDCPCANTTCKTEKLSLETISPDASANKRVINLSVNCPFPTCNFRGKLKEIKNHLSKCDYKTAEIRTVEKKIEDINIKLLKTNECLQNLGSRSSNDISKLKMDVEEQKKYITELRNHFKLVSDKLNSSKNQNSQSISNAAAPKFNFPRQLVNDIDLKENMKLIGTVRWNINEALKSGINFLPVSRSEFAFSTNQRYKIWFEFLPVWFFHGTYCITTNLIIGVAIGLILGEFMWGIFISILYGLIQGVLYMAFEDGMLHLCCNIFQRFIVYGIPGVIFYRLLDIAYLGILNRLIEKIIIGTVCGIFGGLGGAAFGGITNGIFFGLTTGLLCSYCGAYFVGKFSKFFSDILLMDAFSRSNETNYMKSKGIFNHILKYLVMCIILGILSVTLSKKFFQLLSSGNYRYQRIFYIIICGVFGGLIGSFFMGTDIITGIIIGAVCGFYRDILHDKLALLSVNFGVGILSGLTGGMLSGIFNEIMFEDRVRLLLSALSGIVGGGISGIYGSIFGGIFMKIFAENVNYSVFQYVLVFIPSGIIGGILGMIFAFMCGEVFNNLLYQIYELVFKEIFGRICGAVFTQKCGGLLGKLLVDKFNDGHFGIKFHISPISEWSAIELPLKCHLKLIIKNENKLNASCTIQKNVSFDESNQSEFLHCSVTQLNENRIFNNASFWNSFFLFVECSVYVDSRNQC